MESEEDGSPWDDDPHVQKPHSAGRTALEYIAIVTDYLSIPLCVIAILANILLIVVILKYQRLRTRINYYLLNFAIFHICYILSTPVFYIILEIFYNGELEVHWYCVWIRVENFGIGLTLSFIAGYGIDTFLEKIRPKWFSKYEQRYYYVFSFLYFSHILLYAASACICLKRGFTNNFNFYFLTIYYFSIVTTIIYVIYKNKKLEGSQNNPHALKICLITILCWLPLFILYNLLNVFRNVHSVEHILWYTAFLPEYIAYCCSIITVCNLWKSSRYFKCAFRKTLRRTVTDDEYNELHIRNDEL